VSFRKTWTLTTPSSSATAKNKLKQDAQAIKATRKTASFVNTTPNQPSSSRNAASGVEAAAKDIKDASAPLPRDSRLGKYFEYDLSKLHNSKGGFLTEEDGDERQKLIAIQREKARERARIAAGEEPGAYCYPGNDRPITTQTFQYAESCTLLFQ
jgi:DNA-repair protein complementing XP-A cells